MFSNLTVDDAFEGRAPNSSNGWLDGWHRAEEWKEGMNEEKEEEEGGMAGYVASRWTCVRWRIIAGIVTLDMQQELEDGAAPPCCCYNATEQM